MENKVKEICRKNNKINDFVKRVFNKSIPTIEYNNGHYKFTPEIDKIMHMEMKKIISIYLAEFSTYISDEKERQMLNTKISIYESEELDAHGYAGEIAFPSDAQKFLDDLYRDKFFPIKYIQENNGKIKYDINGEYNNLENVKEIGKEGENCILNEEEKIENDANFRDFCVYAKLTNMKDREFFLSAMPHELMHTLGFGGGIFEGETENLTRQVCSKYNITFSPLAHSEETHIMQQIEKIIGGENLKKLTYRPSYESVEDVETINELLNQKIATEEGKDLFKKYAYYDNQYFLIAKSQETSKEEQEKLWQKYKESADILKNTIEAYVREQGHKLHKLGEEKEELSIEDKMSKNWALDKVLQLQDIEIEYLELLVEGPEHEIKDKNKDTEELEL